MFQFNLFLLSIHEFELKQAGFCRCTHTQGRHFLHPWGAILELDSPVAAHPAAVVYDLVTWRSIA